MPSARVLEGRHHLHGCANSVKVELLHNANKLHRDVLQVFFMLTKPHQMTSVSDAQWNVTIRIQALELIAVDSDCWSNVGAAF